MVIVLEPMLRRDIVTIAKELVERGWFASASGSISARIDNDLVLSTPDEAPLDGWTRDSLVKVSLSDRRRFTNRQPTAAFPIHRAIYAETHVGAVVHIATAEIPPSLRPTFAAQSPSGLGSDDSLYSPDHGLFVWGSDLAQAKGRLLSLARAESPNHQEALELNPTHKAAEREPTGAASPIPRSAVCNACGRCTINGGVLPSAVERAALELLPHIPHDQLAAIIAESTYEVLAEKGLL